MGGGYVHFGAVEILCLETALLSLLECGFGWGVPSHRPTALCSGSGTGPEF